MSDMRKIVALNGSHRSEKGITEIVLRKFLEGVKSTNADYEVLYPSKAKIMPCDSCGKCLFETPGICKFNDDMDSIIQKLDAADLLIFASPVYFDSMTSNMKKMFERLRSTLGASFEFRNGRTYHPKRNKKAQKAVTIVTAGNPEKETFISISRTLNRIIETMGGQVVGEFHFPGSHLIIREPELVKSNLDAIAACGQEFAQDGNISKKLLDEANRSYIDDPENVVQGTAKMILEMREEHQRSRSKL